ncbi:unnamed protein product [Trichogramma brassicae]|uniref:Uncharacterized protein n=1 Tax=Trichogramma brassicae TaxID=86971 RepID=A0A6H5J2Y5_9HYME|nr:unnamed protein product [Trichogramma brassicae]
MVELCPGDRVAFLLTAQALLQHKAVDDAQQKWFEKCVCSRLGTPHEINLDLLCHGRDDEESIYRVEHATFWLMALTLVHDGRLEYEQEFLFTMYIDDMLERYETTYSGPQCHVENWDPEEDGICPICQRKFSEEPPSAGPCSIETNAGIRRCQVNSKSNELKLIANKNICRQIPTYERAQIVHLPQKLCRNSGENIEQLQEQQITLEGSSPYEAKPTPRRPSNTAGRLPSQPTQWPPANTASRPPGQPALRLHANLIGPNASACTYKSTCKSDRQNYSKQIHIESKNTCISSFYLYHPCGHRQVTHRGGKSARCNTKARAVHAGVRPHMYTAAHTGVSVRMDRAAHAGMRPLMYTAASTWDRRTGVQGPQQQQQQLQQPRQWQRKPELSKEPIYHISAKNPSPTIVIYAYELNNPIELMLNTGAAVSVIKNSEISREATLYRGDRDLFWLAAQALVRHEHMDDAHQYWFARCVDTMLSSYSTTYSGPQCHIENWEPEEDEINRAEIRRSYNLIDRRKNQIVMDFSKINASAVNTYPPTRAARELDQNVEHMLVQCIQPGTPVNQLQCEPRMNERDLHRESSTRLIFILFLCPGDRVAFLLTAQALLQHRAVDDAQQKWFEKCVCSRPVTPHEIHLDLLCHGRDDEESIYRVEHAAFWLMALTLVHDGRLEYDQEFLFTIYIENMLESYETSYSGPQCHVENWEPEEDGVCPICQRRKWIQSSPSWKKNKAPLSSWGNYLTLCSWKWPIERQQQNQDMEVENIQEEGEGRHDMLVDATEMNHGGGKRISFVSNDDATSPTPSKKIRLCGGGGGASGALKTTASSSNIISSSTTSNHSSASQRNHQK